jgi:hypothetical protein
MALITSTALVCTPYLWAYDQILLSLAILAIMGSLAWQRFSYLLVAPGFIWISTLALGLLFVALEVGNDTWSVMVSASCLGLAYFALHREKRNGPFSP